MRFGDCVRLGIVNLRAHKKRVIIVTVIVGLLFSFLMAMYMLASGFYGAANREASRMTEGKMIVFSEPDMRKCKDSCDVEAMEADIRERMWQYRASLIEVSEYQTEDGTMYQMAPELVSGAIEADLARAPEGVPIILASNQVLGTWLGITPEMGPVSGRVDRVTGEANLQKMREIRQQAVGRVIKSPSGQEYYVAGIAPGSYGPYSNDIRAMGNNNAILMILSETTIGADNRIILLNEADGLGEKVEHSGRVWGAFANWTTAEEYYHEPVNQCNDFLQDSVSECNKEHKYFTEALLGTFAFTEMNRQGQMWGIIGGLAVVLIVLAVIIMLATYLRLMGQDAKVIALYRAMGATRGEVILIYLIYFLMLSLIVTGFALGLAVIVMLIMTFVDGPIVGQVLALTYGVPVRLAWLMGWNKMILVIIAVILLVVPACVLLGMGQFGGKELARKLK